MERDRRKNNFVSLASKDIFSDTWLYRILEVSNFFWFIRMCVDLMGQNFRAENF